MASALLVPVAGPAAAQSAPSWPDSFMGRLEVLALIEQLNGALLASHSATATLDAWCADHHIADAAHIAAIRDQNADKPLSDAQRAILAVSANEPVRYRRVHLACGAHVLSEAENWYVPSRLSAAMNQSLDTTDTPFGVAVKDLQPTRQTLSVERLWSPLPPGWDRKAQPAELPANENASLAIPRELFRHVAVVLDAGHHPIALVTETYRNEVLNYRH
jgi:chorismate-pyruvate lyase